MPFTFSHPAFVLPLALLPKRWVSLTGLVFGSIAPDFEKFFKMRLGNTYSHSWESIFWFSLPVALLLSFLYHLVVRDILFDNLPKFLFQRLNPFKRLHWTSYLKKNIVPVVVSILFGASSHLLLDNLTHKHGAFVPYFPFLRHKILLFNFQISLVWLLDITCSLLGSISIGYLLLRLCPEQVPNKPASQKYIFWVAVSLGVVIIFLLRLLFSIKLKGIWDLGISLISAALFSLILVSGWVKLGFVIWKEKS